MAPHVEEEKVTQSKSAEGPGYVVTILVRLSLVLLVAGGVLVVSAPHYGFTLLAAAVLIGIFAHMVQASGHHRDLMEMLGTRESRD